MNEVTIAKGSARPARTAEAADSLQKVTQMMARLQVRGLPRNYELFHEALFGHDAGLSREIMAITAPPSQLTLDQIGLKYRLSSHCGVAEASGQRDAETVLKALTSELSEGVSHKKAFTRALETIVHSIKKDSGRGMRELLDELDYLSTAATDLLKSEDALSQRIHDGLERIETAAKRALAANAASLRDRLTHLPNRIAFSNRLAGLYEGDANPRGTALVIASVGQFRAIAAEFGEDAANRILRRLAIIFRKTIKKNDFVARIGTDQFAFFFGDVTIEAARAIAERLHVSVADNLVFATDRGTENGRLELQIGIALTDGAMSAGQLLGQAEAALGAAGKNARVPVVCFSPELMRAA